MSAVRRSRAGRAAGLAGLLLLAPAIAACGGSSGGSKAQVSASVGTGGAKVSASVSPLPSVSVTGSNGPLQVGQNVTLTGTVEQVLIPGGYIFLMTTSAQPNGVPVGAFTGAKVKAGDSVVVKGTVASVNLQQLTSQFGGQLTDQAKKKLQQLNGQSIVNATSVTVGGAGASAAPSASASS